MRSIIGGPRWAAAAMMLLVTYACGAKSLVDDVTSNPLEHLNRAIATLENQSASWQGTLKELEDQLRQDAQATIANEVAQVAAKGIATGGNEIRCNVDFIRVRMKQDLQRLVAQIKREPIPPVEPALCQVVPTSVDMGHLPGQLEYYGYDLNAPTGGGIQVVLRHDGGETPLDTWVANPTHYLKTLSVRAAPLCNKENRKIVLRYDGTDRSTVNVDKRECPRAPDPPAQAAERILWSNTDELAGGVFGVSEDRVYGSRCNPGYVRSQCLVTREVGGGSCSAEGVNPRDPNVRLGWIDDDPKNAQCRVHYGIAPAQGVKCRIQILEVGEQQSRQPDPPCPCW